MLLYHLLLNIVRKISKLENNINNIYDSVYPVGSVYITIDQVDLTTENNELFPGTTWEPIAVGKTLFGSSYWYNQKEYSYETEGPSTDFFEGERQYTTETTNTGSRPYLKSGLPNIQGFAGNSLSDWNFGRDGDNGYKQYELGGPNKLFSMVESGQYTTNAWLPSRGSGWSSSNRGGDAFRTLYFNAKKANSTYGRYDDGPDTPGVSEVIPPAIVVYIWRRVS